MGFGKFVTVETERVIGKFNGAFEFVSKKVGEFLVFENSYAVVVGLGHGKGFREGLGLAFNDLSVAKPP